MTYWLTRVVNLDGRGFVFEMAEAACRRRATMNEANRKNGKDKIDGYSICFKHVRLILSCEHKRHVLYNEIHAKVVEGRSIGHIGNYHCLVRTFRRCFP